MKKEAYVSAINRFIEGDISIEDAMGSAMIFFSEDMSEQLDAIPRDDEAGSREFMRKSLILWREITRDCGLARYQHVLDNVFVAMFPYLAHLTKEEA